MPTGLFFEEPNRKDGFTGLAQAVIVQALQEAGNGNSEALEWLLDPETSQPWFAVACISEEEVRKYVSLGLREFSRKDRTRFSNQRRNDGSILLILYDFLHTLRTAEIG